MLAGISKVVLTREQLSLKFLKVSSLLKHTIKGHNKSITNNTELKYENVAISMSPAVGIG